MAPRTIRPHQIFALVDAAPADRVAQVQIPSRPGAGSLSLLETFVMIAALRAVSAERVFEFGTFLGATTLNIALNLGDRGQVFTLDLDGDSAGGAEQNAADAPLTDAHLAARARLDFMGGPVEGRVVRLTGNSVHFDAGPYRGTIDLVLVDGGHDVAALDADTRNAFAMVRRDKAACILWHDYGNPAYPELTAYLDALSGERALVRVGDTMLCAWFSDPAAAARLGG